MTTTMTEQAAEAAIGAACMSLHLPSVRAEACRLADDAARAGLTHRGYLAEVLCAELDDRQARRRERRIAEGHFPRIKRLAEFDLSAAPSINPASFAAISSLSWVQAGEPLVLLGDPGTGKSHILIGVGVAAAEAGKRVRYVNCAGLVNELAEAADERVLSRVVARYGRLDLLLLDELGYVSLDAKGAELLFQVITEREEKASIAVASNAPFSEWGRTFSDPRLSAAVVDRLTFKAHILETGTQSYRLRSSRAAKGRVPKAPSSTGPSSTGPSSDGPSSDGPSSKEG
jgi:DNA replication protein DnaC